MVIYGLLLTIKTRIGERVHGMNETGIRRTGNTGSSSSSSLKKAANFDFDLSIGTFKTDGTQEDGGCIAKNVVVAGQSRSDRGGGGPSNWLSLDSGSDSTERRLLVVVLKTEVVLNVLKDLNRGERQNSVTNTRST